MVHGREASGVGEVATCMGVMEEGLDWREEAALVGKLRCSVILGWEGGEK